MSDSYVLRTDDAGARRLRLLGRAMSRSTSSVLRRAGLRPGMRCLDVGCGIGMVTRRIARVTGHCLGVDRAPEFIEQASREGGPATFLRLDDADLPSLGETFDLVYARYFLSHQPNPAASLCRMAAAARPGGTLVLEDVDFPGHVCHPPNAAFARYLELYQAVVSRRGGNPRLGRELYPMARAAGLANVRVRLVVAVHTGGPAKRVGEVTMAHIADAVVSAGLASRAEVRGIVAEMRDFRRRPDTQVSIAPTFQVVARVP